MVIKVIGEYETRFANWLFFIFSHKNINIKKDKILTNINNETKQQLERIGIKIINNKHISKTCNKDYKQEYSLIDIENVKSQIKCPRGVYEKIITDIPDIHERCIIHVRRGDYLRFHNMYFTLNKQYIKDVYDNFYKDQKVLIVTDDKQWCSNNLLDLCDDVIVSQSTDILYDFFCLTFGKYIICSCSSFSVFASYLNLNKNCVIPYPYYKKEDMIDLGEKIIPPFANRYNVNDDMKK